MALTWTRNIPHSPKAVIQGQLDITGRQIIAVDPDEVRRTANRMISHQGVTAFAVSGFAGAINPEHELLVKDILQKHTRLFVTCGHELSDTLNFQTRAVTAMLNARIIPRLTRLLSDLEKVMAAGTRCQTVLLETHDQIPKTAGGEPVFMGRTLLATLTGRPDQVTADPSCTNY